MKNHPWLKDFPWEALRNQTLQSPLIISHVIDNFDLINSQSEWKDEDNDKMDQCLKLLRRDSIQGLFSNYEYDEISRLIPTGKNNDG